MKLAAIIQFTVAVLCGAASLGSLIQKVPSKAAKRQNPFHADVQAQRAGAKLYARECASCHGDNRQGRANVPPLARPDVENAAPGTLFWIVTNGSPGRAMPSFAHLPEAQRWQISMFLQTQAQSK